MVRTASSRPWALSALATAMVLMAGLPVAASPLGSASASFSDLRFRLIDLDLNDGITPGAVFQGGGLADLAVLDPVTGQFTYLNSPLTATGLDFGTQFLGNDSASLVVNGPTSAQATATTSNMGQWAEGSTARYDNSWSQSSSAYSSGALTGVGQLGFHPLLGGLEDTPTFTLTLTANTGIVIEGTASSFLHASQQGQAELQADWLAATGFDAPDYFLNSSTNSNINLNAFLFTSSAYDPGSLPDLEVHGSALTWYDTVSASLSSCSTCESSPLEPDVTNTRSRSFTLDFFNYSGQTKDVSLVLQARASVDQYVGFQADQFVPPTDPLPDPEIPPIPEPGTYALMGLGLVGLAWARRRHQHAKD